MTASAETPSPATEHEVLASVRKEFDWMAKLDASHVAIAIKGSVLTLAGEVPAPAQVRYATEAALRVQGVSSVANDITVRVPFKAVQPDREIATAVFESIFWTAVIPRERVKIVVTDQVVTLSGDLDSSFQRQEAERVARRIVGVREVRNDVLIVVKSV
jgi:osmotically-inducible protein OsmY